MKWKCVLSGFVAASLSISAYAAGNCLPQVSAIAQTIASGCGPEARVTNIRRAAWLGDQGYYVTFNRDCVGGLVGYEIQMYSNSCMLERATADLGE